MNHIYFEQKCLYLHPKLKIPLSVTLGLLSLPRPMSQTFVTIGSVKGMDLPILTIHFKVIGAYLGMKVPFIHSLTYILLSVTPGLTASYYFFVSSFQSLR